MDEPSTHKACTCAARVEQLAAIAERTGKPLATVRWISDALTFAGRYRRKDVAKLHVDAAELCRMLIADLGQRRPDALRDWLVSLGIQSSTDVGRIVYAMVDAGLCNASADDKESDFANIFHADDIEHYFRDSGAFAARDWPATIKSAVVWAFYIGGLAILVLRPQVHSGPNSTAIGGMLVGVGWLLSKLRFPRPARFGWAWSTLELRSVGKGKTGN
jgi:uncharacterized repeat protein (TIGR04138 family)